jgi:hypothetical protein
MPSLETSPEHEPTLQERIKAALEALLPESQGCRLQIYGCGAILTIVLLCSVMTFAAMHTGDALDTDTGIYPGERQTLFLEKNHTSSDADFSIEVVSMQAEQTGIGGDVTWQNHEQDAEVLPLFTYPLHPFQNPPRIIPHIPPHELQCTKETIGAYDRMTRCLHDVFAYGGTTRFRWDTRPGAAQEYLFAVVYPEGTKYSDTHQTDPSHQLLLTEPSPENPDGIIDLAPNQELVTSLGNGFFLISETDPEQQTTRMDSEYMVRLIILNSETETQHSLAEVNLGNYNPLITANTGEHTAAMAVFDTDQSIITIRHIELEGAVSVDEQNYHIPEGTTLNRGLAYPRVIQDHVTETDRYIITPFHTGLPTNDSAVDTVLSIIDLQTRDHMDVPIEGFETLDLPPQHGSGATVPDTTNSFIRSDGEDPETYTYESIYKILNQQDR